MSLDRRLSEEFRRTAAHAPAGVDAQALSRVVVRAGGVRRSRRTVLVVAAAVLVAFATLLAVPGRGLLSQRGGPVAPSPHASALPKTFVSSLYGYSMSYPEDWTVTAGTEPWQVGQDIGGAGRRDRFQSTSTDAVFVVSQDIHQMNPTTQWIPSYLPDPSSVAMPTCFPPYAQWEAITIDGHAAAMHGGDYGCSFTEVIVIVDQRAYVFSAQPDPDHVNTRIFDQGLLSRMLASVKLTPQTAAP